ncbi:hypothetical protein GCM10023187_12460 [Nibrella viscosa]|uniref:Uncharacterized protein n=1 Tax=Nibrella viscosa TaxID=1084524 RepID=A0ABP8K3I9_9BACT
MNTEQKYAQAGAVASTPNEPAIGSLQWHEKELDFLLSNFFSERRASNVIGDINALFYEWIEHESKKASDNQRRDISFGILRLQTFIVELQEKYQIVKHFRSLENSSAGKGGEVC